MFFRSEDVVRRLCTGRILEAIRGGEDELQMGVIIKEEALMEF